MSPGALGGLRDRKLPAWSLREGVGGGCLGWQWSATKRVSSCRQVESLLDVVVSRGSPGSTGRMIFKYCTRRRIL